MASNTATKKIKKITWEAFEYKQKDKGADWYFVFGIISVSIVLATVILNQIMLALVLGLSGASLLVMSLKKPSLLSYAISPRGIKIEDEIFAFSDIECFCLDEGNPAEPKLILQTGQRFDPLLVLPVPVEFVEEIDYILEQNVERKQLEDSVVLKALENLGF